MHCVSNPFLTQIINVLFYVFSNLKNLPLLHLGFNTSGTGINMIVFHLFHNIHYLLNRLFLPWFVMPCISFLPPFPSLLPSFYPSIMHLAIIYLICFYILFYYIYCLFCMSQCHTVLVTRVLLSGERGEFPKLYSWCCLFQVNFQYFLKKYNYILWFPIFYRDTDSKKRLYTR